MGATLQRLMGSDEYSCDLKMTCGTYPPSPRLNLKKRYVTVSHGRHDPQTYLQTLSTYLLTTARSLQHKLCLPLRNRPGRKKTLQRHTMPGVTLVGPRWTTSS